MQVIENLKVVLPQLLVEKVEQILFTRFWSQLEIRLL
jgi:hypothetical protein